MRTRTSSLAARISRVASNPSSTGMLTSMSTTSGLERPRELDRLAAVARLADDLDPLVGGEDRLERLGEQPVVVGDEHAERLRLLRAAGAPFILPVSVGLWKRTSTSGSRSCS